MQLQKHHYYYDREQNLVRVITDKIECLDVFAVMSHPNDPFIGNVYFLRSNGLADPMVEDAVDLVEDRTCPVCSGRGVVLVRMGQDTAERKPCRDCDRRGYRK